jgi:endonuclease/exonuclease/phosphatase family metal-dependent hydrolase
MISEKSRKWMMRSWIGIGFLMFGFRFVADSGKYKKMFEDATRSSAPLASVMTPPASAQGRVAPAKARAIKLASWNLEFFDVPGRGRTPRAPEDYAALKRYADTLDADVVAVQEVASPEALSELFPSSEYAYHLASTGGAQRSGFVYRRNLAVSVEPDLEGLALGGDLRAGADIRLIVGGKKLRLLSVHLKAYCATDSLDAPSDDCAKLKAQVPALEAWIDARAAENVPFAVLGDFNRAIGARDDQLYAELDDHQPATLSLRRASLRTHTHCRGRSQNAIDHVVLGGRAGAALSEQGLLELAYDAADLSSGRKLSDHCPIEVTLDTSRM